MRKPRMPDFCSNERTDCALGFNLGARGGASLIGNFRHHKPERLGPLGLRRLLGPPPTQCRASPAIRLARHYLDSRTTVISWAESRLIWNCWFAFAPPSSTATP